MIAALLLRVDFLSVYINYTTLHIVRARVEQIKREDLCYNISSKHDKFDFENTMEIQWKRINPINERGHNP